MSEYKRSTGFQDFYGNIIYEDDWLTGSDGRGYEKNILVGWNDSRGAWVMGGLILGDQIKRMHKMECAIYKQDRMFTSPDDDNLEIPQYFNPESYFYLGRNIDRYQVKKENGVSFDRKKCKSTKASKDRFKRPIRMCHD